MVPLSLSNPSRREAFVAAPTRSCVLPYLHPSGAPPPSPGGTPQPSTAVRHRCITKPGLASSPEGAHRAPKRVPRLEAMRPLSNGYLLRSQQPLQRCRTCAPQQRIRGGVDSNSECAVVTPSLKQPPGYAAAASCTPGSGRHVRAVLEPAHSTATASATGHQPQADLR